MSVFNSPLESGVRIIAFLNAYFPEEIDFESLLKIDYVIVNSAELGGPKSIHPFTPNKIGELISRRSIVREGIELMIRFGMIQSKLNEEGIYYKVTDQVQPYLKLMKSNYSKLLIESSIWLAKEVKRNKFNNIDIKLSKKVF